MTVSSLWTATILTVLVHRSLQLVCPHGWTYLNDRCWNYSHELRTWQKARDDCFRYGADLASISDEQENRFLHTLIGDQLDIGLAALTLNGFTPHRIQADDLTCFQKFPDSALVGLAEVALEEFRTVEQCLQECLRSVERYNFMCLSAMWYRDRFQCILNSDTKSTNSQFFTSTSGSGEAIDYYENNCKNGGGGGGGGGNVGGGGGSVGGGTGIERCFEKFPHSILVGYADLVVKDIPVDICLENCRNCQNCIDGQPCKAVMYFRDFQECILVTETKNDFPKDFVTDDAEADYYEPKANCDAGSGGGGGGGGGGGIGGGGGGGGGACPNQHLDVLLIVDSSGSIGPIDFNNIRSFLNLIVDYLDISPNRSQVGMVSFNEDAFTDFHLNSYQTKEQIKAAIEGVGWRNGHTKIGNALQYGLTKELLREQGDRPSVPNVILVLTDGMSQDNPSPPAQIMRNQGMHIFAIGVTDAVNDEQLKNIAGSPDRVYKTRDFSSLDERLREQIMQQICGENIGGSNNVGVLPLPANSLGGNPLDDTDGTEVALRDPRISNTQLQLDNGVWLGAKLMDRGSFAWADGSEANFTKWKFGQPDRQSEDECIVSAFEPLQQWSDVPCNKPHGFVCALRPRMSLNQKLHQDFAVTKAFSTTRSSLSTQTRTTARHSPSTLAETTARHSLSTLAETTAIHLLSTQAETTARSQPPSTSQERDLRANAEREIRRFPPTKSGFPPKQWIQFDSVLSPSQPSRGGQPGRPPERPKPPSFVPLEFPARLKPLLPSRLRQQRPRTGQPVWDLRRRVYVYQ